MAGNYPFQKEGGNPYDWERVFNDFSRDPAGQACAHNMKETPPERFYHMLNKTRDYFSEQEQRGVQLRRSEMSPEFVDLYSKSNSDPEHYASFFRILWKGGYSFDDIKDSVNRLAEKHLSSGDTDTFLAIVNKGMSIFYSSMERK